MWLVLRGTVNFLGIFPLIAVGYYSLLWTLFFWLEGLQGRPYGNMRPFQVLTAGVLCLYGTAMVVVFAAFLGARGRHLVRRRWLAIPKVTINPAAIKALTKISWIPPTVGTIVTVPFYLVIWGVPVQVNPATITLLVLALIPSVIAHEFLHAVGYWIAGRVPSNQIRFGVLIRYATPYAYTRHDMPV